MKRKGLLVVLLCVMGLATISIGNVEAAGPWYTCTISGAGATSTDSAITLTDTATTPGFPANTTYFIDNSTQRANQMLAAALTAFANSTNVVVYLADTAPYSTTSAVIAVK